MKYGDRVKILDNFYVGFTGTLKERQISSHPSIYRYLVHIDVVCGYVWFTEEELELIKQPQV